MSTSPAQPPPLPTNRPALVWVISIFYFVSIGWGLFSIALVYSGFVPLTGVQKAYFEAQTVFDCGSTALVTAANLIGAVLLFLLRKQALHFFVAAFSVGLILTFYQAVAKNWLGAIGAHGLVGSVIGSGINIAIILYTWRLVSKGVLR